MALRTVGCKVCGLVMTNPQPSPSDMVDFYKNHYRSYYQKREHPSEAYIREFKKDIRSSETADFLVSQKLIAHESTVLDIGASEGCILKAIRDVLPQTKRIAVEPNANFRSFARDYAACDVFESIETFTQAHPDSKVDLIIFNHVFEHLTDPIQTLHDIRPMMHPEGHIYIDVPDITEYKDLGALHIAHLYHFSINTIKLAATAAGYVVTHAEKYQPTMHPASIRCVLRQTTERTSFNHKSDDNNTDWKRIIAIDKKAASYLRKRWGLWKRLKYYTRSRSSI